MDWDEDSTPEVPRRRRGGERYKGVAYALGLCFFAAYITSATISQLATGTMILYLTT
jgi:hypothetical protein